MPAMSGRGLGIDQPAEGRKETAQGSLSQRLTEPDARSGQNYLSE